MSFDYRSADSQGTLVEPINPKDFDIDEYCEYESLLLDRCRKFWEGNSGVLVYRRFRVPEVFSYGCRDMKRSLELQLAALKESMKYKADIPNFLEPWYGIGTVASAFGADYIWNEGQAPATKTVFASIKDALNYEYRPVESTSIGKHVLDIIEYFLDNTKGKLPMSLSDVQSPLNIASYLVNFNTLFLDMYDDPEGYMKLQSIITDLLIEFNKKQAQIIGDALAAPGHGFASSREFSGIGLSDDNSIMISNSMYEEYQVPYMEKIGQDESCNFKVLPAFRPDNVLDINEPGFAQYIKKLGEVCGINIKTMDDVKTALASRIEYFVKMGCKTADHAMEYIVYRSTDANLDAVLQQALDGNLIDREEADEYKAELLMFCASQYKRHKIVMQLHYGTLKNANPAAYTKLGPATGFDAICGYDKSGVALGALLGALEASDSLPRTIIYSLNPTDNALIDSVIGCFQSSEIPGKIQHGSAWWFNDTKTGMIEHMTSLANFSILPNFIGMLTDSRSFLSYTRHEYFRRILCDLIGQWVENGEYPADMETLGKMVEDICYNNAVRYFEFEI